MTTLVAGFLSLGYVRDSGHGYSTLTVAQHPVRFYVQLLYVNAPTKGG